MKVFVNKNEEIHPEYSTLLDVISKNEKYNNGVSHVVLNGKFMYRSEYEKIILKENDNVRILPVPSGG